MLKPRRESVPVHAGPTGSFSSVNHGDEPYTRSAAWRARDFVQGRLVQELVTQHSARVPHSHRSSPTWHDAAERAGFSFYEASGGGERWAGGFTSDGTQIEVLTLVDGEEVSVQSSVAVDAGESVRRKAAIADLLWHRALEFDDKFSLPYSFTIERDDRDVVVDGQERVVPGMRIEGHPRWVGLTRVDGVAVKITTDSKASLSLRKCEDHEALSENPPHRR